MLAKHERTTANMVTSGAVEHTDGDDRPGVSAKCTRCDLYASRRFFSFSSHRSRSSHKRGRGIRWTLTSVDFTPWCGLVSSPLCGDGDAGDSGEDCVSNIIRREFRPVCTFLDVRIHTSLLYVHHHPSSEDCLDWSLNARIPLSPMPSSRHIRLRGGNRRLAKRVTIVRAYTATREALRSSPWART